MSKDAPKHTRPDSLVKPGKKAGIELSESELKAISGGAPANKAGSSPTESLSLNFSKIETS
ncbi:MAG TPA: bacteriocin [Dongiaceae bacterium]|nr:bacteriocin [Dongiaceae bacterium]